MKIANRKAKDEREARLSALEAYANLKNEPEDWTRFRLKYPNFFPSNLSDWFYDYAHKFFLEHKNDPEMRAVLKPSLLFYSDRLRLVWSRNDPDGAYLKLLYGFEMEGGARATRTGILVTPGNISGKDPIPGQPLEWEKQTTIAGLPPGKPIVRVDTGLIDWEFGCDLQQSVYDLMQQRWRAMVCPECSKFFLADKPNQKFCSTSCFGEVKRKRSLEHYHLKGNDDRKRRMKKGKAK